MAYSRIKVWIAAEILSASDLNNEHNGHITNENDLDSRLISEISARSALETEHDVFYAACWNAGSSEIAANKVSKNSMKDNAIGTAELDASAVIGSKISATIKDPAAGTAGLRTLGSGGQQAMPGNATPTPSDGSVTYAKMANTSAGNICLGGSFGEENGNPGATWVKIKELHIGHKGTYRIKFDLKSSGSAVSARGRIYKNGVAVGIAQNEPDIAWATKSEDIAGWVAGDLCQLYINNDHVQNTVYVRNFKVCCDGARTVW